ncbi:MAG: S-adenosylmethionine:tRNA ribosyltransferase-isomerase [Kofleriaceae bacterium]
MKWARDHAAELALAAREVSRRDVRLVAIDRRSDRVAVVPFAQLPALLDPGDVVVVNDAATLPGSLRGMTGAGAAFELRLSAPIDGRILEGVVFGTGDWRTRTEDRPEPPVLAVGARVQLGAIAARVMAATGRRVTLEALATTAAVWELVYRAGAPVQYAHRSEPLPLYAVQTAYAARPWAAEMPSAGRPLTWSVLLGLRRGGIELATLTHAAGLSSTGDAALDEALPWPERYEIPVRTAAVIARARSGGSRVIAIGTTVVRALEASGGVAGAGIATLRLGGGDALRVVDGLVSGLHVPGESHFELLRAFAPRERLTRALALAAASGLSSHELGDACSIL